jgi:hypothetical protein
MQNQVSAALEVKAKVNAIRECVCPRLAIHSLGYAKDAIEANQEHSEDQHNSAFEILLHRFTSLFRDC